MRAAVAFTVAPAASGETLSAARIQRELPPGDSLIETELAVDQPRLWELNDPYLYRVTARASVDSSTSFDEQLTRCGFRDFRLQDGCFRLNGRRIYLKSSHTGGDVPIGIHVAADPGLLRKDMLNCKVMGANMVRFIAGVAHRRQLDLCDEIGLLVFEECAAGWLLEDSPQMGERFDHDVLEMIRRDRNHPSLVIWGLLNETTPGPVFLQAVRALPKVRVMDDSRVVMLNSGSFDGFIKGGHPKGPATWRMPWGLTPSVTKNCLPTPLVFNRVAWSIYASTTWLPGQVALHPGADGQYSVVRWTAPAAGEYALAAVFTGMANQGAVTTDVHVLHQGKSVFDGFLNLHGQANQATFAKTLTLEKGDAVDAVVGPGDGDPYDDATALELTIKSADGRTFDVAADFQTGANPKGVWTYGYLAPGERPDAGTFQPYSAGEPIARLSIGRICNPGSQDWEDLLYERHPYPNAPHDARTVRMLRTLDGEGRPYWLSEYGVGSAVDLVRLARHYEQLGKTSAEDAVFYHHWLDQFMADWRRWNLADTFANPEDYFRQCVAGMAGYRKVGINAVRASPNVIGYNLTGTQDQGFTGEGLTTTFRELKPGTVDAMFDVWRRWRWCLFVEPVQVYRGRKAQLEAVLANEDALLPGDYPVRLQVVGPRNVPVFDRTISVHIADPQIRPAQRFALPVFAQDVVIDGPSGKYRFLAAFQRGGAAAGGEAEFYLADPAEMPPVQSEVVLWGDDAQLSEWLKLHGIKTRALTPGPQPSRQVILAGAVRPQAAPRHSANWPGRSLAVRTPYFFLPTYFRTTTAIERVGCRW